MNLHGDIICGKSWTYLPRFHHYFKLQIFPFRILVTCYLLNACLNNCLCLNENNWRSGYTKTIDTLDEARVVRSIKNAIIKKRAFLRNNSSPSLSLSFSQLHSTRSATVLSNNRKNHVRTHTEELRK